MYICIYIHIYVYIYGFFFHSVMPKEYGCDVRLETTESHVLLSMTRMMDWHKSPQKDEQTLSKCFTN